MIIWLICGIIMIVIGVINEMGKPFFIAAKYREVSRVNSHLRKTGILYFILGIVALIYFFLNPSPESDRSLIIILGLIAVADVVAIGALNKIFVMMADAEIASENN